MSRQQQAGEATRRETRRLLLLAAREEFAERGYTGATVTRIAARAGVAVPTLYAAWGSKRALLRAVMGQAVTELDDGFDAHRDRNDLLGTLPPATRTDAAAFLTHLAHRYRLIAERSALGWQTYRDAAGADTDIAEDWQRLQTGRRHTFEVLLANLPDDALSPGLSMNDAVDTCWAIASPETHELFVTRRGWTYDHYEQWVQLTLTRALLNDADAGRRG